MFVYLGSDDYVVDLGATTNLNMNHDIELALRFTTGIKNGDEFFTDLNGFQVFSSTMILYDQLFCFLFFIKIDNTSENI